MNIDQMRKSHLKWSNLFSVQLILLHNSSYALHTFADLITLHHVTILKIEANTPATLFCNPSCLWCGGWKAKLESTHATVHTVWLCWSIDCCSIYSNGRIWCTVDSAGLLTSSLAFASAWFSAAALLTLINWGVFTTCSQHPGFTVSHSSLDPENRPKKGQIERGNTKTYELESDDREETM